MEEDIILTKNDQFLLIQVNEDGTIVQANCMGVIDVIDGLADNVKLLSEKINVPIQNLLIGVKRLKNCSDRASQIPLKLQLRCKLQETR